MKIFFLLEIHFCDKNRVSEPKIEKEVFAGKFVFTVFPSKLRYYENIFLLEVHFCDKNRVSEPKM